MKNRNIIDILSSKQSAKNFDVNYNTIQNKKKLNKNNNNNNLKKNLNEKFNSASTFNLPFKNLNVTDKINSSTTSFKNNNNTSKNKKSINAYAYNNKSKKNFDIGKKWESNILNLTTKENNDNNYKKKDSKIKIKKNFFINDSFLITNTNKDNTYYKNNYNTTYNTSLNSTKNISNKSKHLKMNSSDLFYNKMKNKNKYENSKNLKKQKNNSTTMINTSSTNKTNLLKNSKIINSSLKDNNKSEKSEKILDTNNGNIRNYYGPINISLINMKKKEELEDDIILKMIKQGFECKKMNNFIKCHEKGKTIEIEIVKISGNMLYYLTKIFNTK